MHRIKIVTNDSGPEAFFAAESARNVARVLNAPVVHLQENGWLSLVDELKEDTIVFLATHGGFGEDGTLQAALEARQIMHTHSAAWTCSVMTDKHMSKMLYLDLGIDTPAWTYRGHQFGRHSDSDEWVRKPIAGGSKNGVSLSVCAGAEDRMLYEVYVPGRLEVAISVLGNDAPIALPPLIRTRRRDRLGQLVRSNACLSGSLANSCRDAALAIHKALRARGVTKTDFVISANGKALALETDALPALGPKRSAASQAREIGLDYEEFVWQLATDHGRFNVAGR